MHESTLQAMRAVGFLVAALVAIALQRFRPHAGLRGSVRVNAALWILGAVVVGLVCGGCAFWAARWAAREEIGLLNQARVGAWVGIPATVVLLDLVSYAWHRANHRVPALWRLHQVHHSDSSFTVSTGVRFHPGELLLSLPLRLAAVVLLGAPVAGVLAFEVVLTLSNLLEHGDIDVPRGVERTLGRLLVTPALHRHHHTKCGRERDTNFGTVFSTWDRMCGTFVENDSATRVDTGLRGLEQVTLARALALPFERRVA